MDTLDKNQVAEVLRSMLVPLHTSNDTYYIGVRDSQDHANKRVYEAADKLGIVLDPEHTPKPYLAPQVVADAVEDIRIDLIIDASLYTKDEFGEVAGQRVNELIMDLREKLALPKPSPGIAEKVREKYYPDRAKEDSTDFGQMLVDACHLIYYNGDKIRKTGSIGTEEFLRKYPFVRSLEGITRVLRIRK